jgi:nucleoside-diphosphate-sugar epimerase
MVSDQFFNHRKILVTGASGFIGTHLCRFLRKNGAEVHAVSRTKHYDKIKDLYWWQADLTEVSIVREIFVAIQPEIIFHLASHVAGARESHVVLPTFRSNLMSTVNLLTVAGEIGCHRIILTGSLEEPDLENPESIPCSPYAAAKWASSAYARMFHALYQLPVVILRVFMVYGPGQQDLRKLIPYVILSLLQGEVPKLSSGQRQIDWIYVDDVIAAFFAAAQAANIEGSTIDVGSGTLVSIETIVEQLVQLINPQIRPLFGALVDRPFEQVRVANVIKAHAMMKWQPVTSLEVGLQRAVDWYARRLSTIERA